MNQKQMSVDCLIKSCEGIKLEAYLDSVGIITIGIGIARCYPNGDLIKLGDTCSEQQAYDWLNDHLEKEVYPTVDHLQQLYNFDDKVYAALCSFAYNEGISTLKTQSFLDALYCNDLNELASVFRKYVYAGGKILEGLVNRREKEIQYFM